MTTASTTPVSLLVGFANFSACFFVDDFTTLRALFGFVNNVTNRALIVLSSKIFQNGSASL